MRSTIHDDGASLASRLSLSVPSESAAESSTPAVAGNQVMPQGAAEPAEGFDSEPESSDLEADSEARPPLDSQADTARVTAE